MDFETKVYQKYQKLQKYKDNEPVIPEEFTKGKLISDDIYTDWTECYGDYGVWEVTEDYVCEIIGELPPEGDEPRYRYEKSVLEEFISNGKPTGIFRKGETTEIEGWYSEDCYEQIMTPDGIEAWKRYKGDSYICEPMKNWFMFDWQTRNIQNIDRYNHHKMNFRINNKIFTIEKYLIPTCGVREEDENDEQIVECDGPTHKAIYTIAFLSKELNDETITSLEGFVQNKKMSDAYVGDAFVPERLIGTTDRLKLHFEDLSKLTTTKQMVYHCKFVTSVIFDYWNDESLVDVSQMFAADEFSYLSYVEIPGFKGDKIVDATEMFATCQNMSIDCINKIFRDFRGNSLKYANDMLFALVNSTDNLYLPNFEGNVLEQGDYMFSNLRNAEEINLPSFTGGIDGASLHGAFYNCDKAKTILLPSLKYNPKTDYTYFFGKCSKLEYLDLSSFHIPGEEVGVWGLEGFLDKLPGTSKATLTIKCPLVTALKIRERYKVLGIFSLADIKFIYSDL